MSSTLEWIKLCRCEIAIHEHSLRVTYDFSSCAFVESWLWLREASTASGQTMGLYEEKTCTESHKQTCMPIAERLRCGVCLVEAAWVVNRSRTYDHNLDHLFSIAHILLIAQSYRHCIVGKVRSRIVCPLSYSLFSWQKRRIFNRTPYHSRGRR